MDPEGNRSVAGRASAPEKSALTDGEQKAGRRKRVVQAALNKKLGEKQCANCGTVGCWRVEQVKGDQRFVICLGCQRREQLVIRDSGDEFEFLKA